jgi:acyl-CoA thioesterase
MWGLGVEAGYESGRWMCKLKADAERENEKKTRRWRGRGSEDDEEEEEEVARAILRYISEFCLMVTQPLLHYVTKCNIMTPQPTHPSQFHSALISFVFSFFWHRCD